MPQAASCSLDLACRRQLGSKSRVDRRSSEIKNLSLYGLERYFHHNLLSLNWGRKTVFKHQFYRAAAAAGGGAVTPFFLCPVQGGGVWPGPPAAAPPSLLHCSAHVTAPGPALPSQPDTNSLYTGQDPATRMRTTVTRTHDLHCADAVTENMDYYWDMGGL